MERKDPFIIIGVMVVISVTTLGILVFFYSLFDEAGGSLIGVSFAYFLIFMTILISAPILLQITVKLPQTRKPIVIYIIIVVLLISSIWIYRSFIRINNVFDQLYYTQHTGFGHMEDAKRIEGPMHYEMGFTEVWFRGDSLNTPEITFSFNYPSDENMRISFYCYYNNERLHFSYRYNIRTKELLLVSPLTASSAFSDEIIGEIEDLPRSYLFDYFLPLWHETTQSSTRFSPDNWGRFIIIE